MMHREKLPITALSAGKCISSDAFLTHPYLWSRLNDINFLDIKVQDLGGSKGYGLVTERSLNSHNTFDLPTLLEVPRDLILSAEGIEEYAKVDHHFRQLLDVAGGESTRKDVMLFLLMSISSTTHSQNVGLSNPWTEYVKMLPDDIPLPTMWSDEELKMLAGTSLEAAVDAKMRSLLAEFEALRQKTTGISWSHKCWWENEDLSFDDWLLLDALYRSRCLELPNVGEAMIPCMDMANHSSEPNAYYEHSNGISLLLRPNLEVDIGSEITISYGNSKSKAEMLFSYGFLDVQSEVDSLSLPIEPFLDDPLGRAKVSAFSGSPVICIFKENNVVKWKSEFSYLLCLNEEDGLEFRVLQQTDGTRSSLRVFWRGTDVTEKTNDFEILTADHELKDIFKLRVVALLQDRIRQQLEDLYESEENTESFAVRGLASEGRRLNAIELRQSEAALLEEAFGTVETERNALLESEVVIRYLGSMDVQEPQDQEDTNEEDFS